MNTLLRSLVFSIFLVLSTSPLLAVQTSLFWTYCTTDVLPTGTGSFAAVNYFTVFNRRGHGSELPFLTGLEYGFFTLGDWSLEAGIDYLGGTDDPLFFNAKLAIPENKLAPIAPSFSIGAFNFGTRTRSLGRTNQNVVDIVFGKTLPEWIGGHLFVGAYSGSRALGATRQGWMVGYYQSFCPAVHCDGTKYFKWSVGGDYASGKNAIGGGGVALYHYFTPNVFVQTGPVWFNTTKYNGSWKWSVQIFITFPVIKS